MFENVDGWTDGWTTEARVTGILLAHLGAFGSGELNSNHREMTISWSFSYYSFFVKIFGNHNMPVLFSNLCYNEVCYKGTACIKQFLYLLCNSSRLFCSRISSYVGVCQPLLGPGGPS